MLIQSWVPLALKHLNLHPHFTDEETGPKFSSLSVGGSMSLNPGLLPSGLDFLPWYHRGLFLFETVSSPSWQVFKSGRELQRDFSITWGSLQLLPTLSFSGPGGERHPSPTVSPGAKSPSRPLVTLAASGSVCGQGALPSGNLPAWPLSPCPISASSGLYRSLLPAS